MSTDPKPATVKSWRRKKWLEVSDDEWWRSNQAIYQEKPGWWLDEPKRYFDWRNRMTTTYASFQRDDDLALARWSGVSY